jgi:hypothetical protein
VGGAWGEVSPRVSWAGPAFRKLSLIDLDFLVQLPRVLFAVLGGDESDVPAMSTAMGRSCRRMTLSVDVAFYSLAAMLSRSCIIFVCVSCFQLLLAHLQIVSQYVALSCFQVSCFVAFFRSNALMSLELYLKWDVDLRVSV